LSRLESGTFLRDEIRKHPELWGTPNLLVKLLDPVERLPVHAHPDRDFALRELGADYGKTEAWIVVDTRAPQAEVWLGLRESVSRGQYREWIDEQNTDALLESLNSLTVRTGDVIFVPAGVPHAIGAGALLVEVQEPSDLSIICEWQGFPIAPENTHLGLGWDRAITALKLEAYAPAIGMPENEFFSVDDRAEPAGRFGVLLVLEGEGELDGERVRAGDAFVLPAACEPFETRGTFTVIRCLGGDL
jgi:mannose-6-phosphate isomerase